MEDPFSANLARWMHFFSYLTEMMSVEKWPGKGEMFLKEAFHALEPPYLAYLIGKDKEKVMFNMMTHILEMGYIFVWLTDDVVKGNVELAPPKVEVKQLTQVVMELDD